VRALSIRRPLLDANEVESVILRHPDLAYRSLSIVLAKGKHSALMHFEGSMSALRTLRREYVEQRPPYILEIEVVQRSPRSMVLYKTEKSGMGPVEIAGLVYRHFGSHCVTRVTKDVTGATWDILTFRDEAVPPFLAALRSRGVYTELKSAGVTDWKLARYAKSAWDAPLEALSAQQEKTLRRAAELGYYDAPRRADVRAVARALHVPRSTAHLHLQQATRKLVTRALQGL
jgi:hypothetical protein